MPIRRALLYMPGDSRRKIEKALTLNVDSICMDLEDSVTLEQKASARATVLHALRELNFGRSEKLVRLNRFGSGLEQADFDGTIAGHPDGFVLPKVETPEALYWLHERLSEAEQARGWAAGDLRIVAIIETALGIVNLKEICAATPRLQALVFGAEDFAGDMGATRTAAGWEVFYARSAVVTHAAAFGLQAIDMVFVNYGDTEGLARECESGAQMAFTGKQAIHPNQIAPIQTAFTPDDAAIRHAQRVVEAARDHERSGRGAFALDGQMVDAPVIKIAQRLLDKAQAAGKI